LSLFAHESCSHTRHFPQRRPRTDEHPPVQGGRAPAAWLRPRNPAPPLINHADRWPRPVQHFKSRINPIDKPQNVGAPKWLARLPRARPARRQNPAQTDVGQNQSSRKLSPAFSMTTSGAAVRAAWLGATPPQHARNTGRCAGRARALRSASSTRKSLPTRSSVKLLDALRPHADALRPRFRTTRA